LTPLLLLGVDASIKGKNVNASQALP